MTLRTTFQEEYATYQKNIRNAARLENLENLENSWQPIEYSYNDGVPKSHPTPMANVVSGENSCVIIRNVLTPQESAAIIKRLQDRDIFDKYGNPGRGQGDVKPKSSIAMVQSLQKMKLSNGRKMQLY